MNNLLLDIFIYAIWSDCIRISGLINKKAVKSEWIQLSFDVNLEVKFGKEEATGYQHKGRGFGATL